MKELLLNNLGYILGPLLSVAIYSGLRSLKSIKTPLDITQENFSQEDLNAYASYTRIGGVASVAFAAIVGICLYYFFRGAANLYFSHFMPFEITLKLPEVVFAIPAMFMGLVLQYYPIRIISEKIYGKEKFDTLLRISAQKYGFDADKLSKYMHDWGVFLCITFYIKCILTTTYVDSDKIYIRTFLSLTTKEYQLTNIDQLIRAKSFKAPNGNVVHRTRYTLKFSDGFEWEINNDALADREFTDALVSKAKIEYTDKDFY